MSTYEKIKINILVFTYFLFIHSSSHTQTTSTQNIQICNRISNIRKLTLKLWADWGTSSFKTCVWTCIFKRNKSRKIFIIFKTRVDRGSLKNSGALFISTSLPTTHFTIHFKLYLRYTNSTCTFSSKYTREELPILYLKYAYTPFMFVAPRVNFLK